MLKPSRQPTRVLIALLLLAALLVPLVPRSASATQLSKLTCSGSVTGGRQITVRVTLNGPASVGGTLVFLSSNSALVAVPLYVVVPPGESTYAFKVTTKPTFTTTTVTLTAENGTATMHAQVIVKEPYLSSMSVQTVIRAGGYGKVTPRISGPAPAGGVTVTLSVNPSGYLNVPVTAVIPAGQTAVYLKVPASMVDSEVAVTVTASYDGRTISKPTVVRKMS
jgi:hypothetical protein